jgi:hypothetical protein
MRLWTKAAVQGAACGLVFGLVVLIGGRLWWPQVPAPHAKQSTVAEVVRARRFEVVDAAGKVRAVMEVRPQGSPSLVLSDTAGKIQAALLDSQLSFYGLAGQIQAMLSPQEDGTPNLLFVDAKGKPRAMLYLLSEDGRPRLSLHDQAGKPTWKAP